MLNKIYILLFYLSIYIHIQILKMKVYYENNIIILIYIVLKIIFLKKSK